jgi:hypothetical protein
LGRIPFDPPLQNSVCLLCKLLLSADWDCSHLAALGAIITLLALAVDPFSQQLVRPVICHKVVPTTSARVPRTNNITDMSTYVGSVSATPEVGMIAAMYAGLLNVSQPVKFHCLTGNCTFPSKKSTAGSYQTLAVSSACVDISSEYSVTGNGTWHIEKMGNSSLLESWTTLDNYSSATVARTMIPDDGASAVTGYTEYARDTFKEHWPVGIPLTALSQVLFSAITVDLGCSDKNKSAPPCVMPLAVECRMWPVVQTIDARIELGGLVEPIVAETRLQHVFDYLPWHHVSSEVLRRGHLQPYIASPVVTADNPLGMANYTSSGYPTQEDMRWYPQDCVWIVDYHTDRAIWSQLGKFFGRNRLVKVQLGEFRGQRIGKWMYDAPDSDVWMQLLFHNGTSTIDTTAAYMNQLASSMTTYVRMRLTDTAPLAHAYGDTIATKTCIQVRWAWISLPTALVISTALLLALPMSSADRHGSSMSGKGIWKSSSLAVLSNGLEETSLRSEGSTDTVDEMRTLAADIEVSLQPGQDGWKLRQHGLP